MMKGDKVKWTERAHGCFGEVDRQGVIIGFIPAVATLSFPARSSWAVVHDEPNEMFYQVEAADLRLRA